VPQRPVKRGIATSVRKAEKAATHDWAFIAKRYPLIERHASIVLSEQRDRPTVPDQKIMRKTRGSKVLIPDIELRRPVPHGRAFRGYEWKGYVPTFKAILARDRRASTWL
jgi:hypothetical protein